MNRRRILTAAAAAALLPPPARAAVAPLRVAVLELPVSDGRICRVRVIAYARSERSPVLVFSHGAASTALAYDQVLLTWARAGYLVLAPDHLDAGRTPPESELSHARLWTSRVLDLQAALDGAAAVEALGRTQGWRPDWRRVGAAGHSLGALVAEALAGARAEPPVLQAADPRVRAVVALSPPGVRPGFVPPATWSPMRAPVLVHTGTADVLPGFIDDWRLHLASFLGAGSRVRWAAVGDGADHYAGGRICRLSATPDPRQEIPFQALLRTSSNFLDAHVAGDAAAERRLQDDFERQALQPALSLYRG